MSCEGRADPSTEGKTGSGWGIAKHKAEFEDLASAARAGKVPLGEVRRAFEENA